MTEPQLRRLGTISWLSGFIFLLLGISFYYLPGAPTTPNVATGQTHQLNNHGYIAYLNHRQWVAHVTFLLLSLLFGIVFGLTVREWMKMRKV